MLKKYIVPCIKAFGFAISFFITVLVMNLMAVPFLTNLPGDISSIFSGVLNLFAAFLITFVFLKIDKKSFKDVGIDIRNIQLRKILKGSLEGFAVVLSLLLIMLITGFAALRGLNVVSIADAVILLFKGTFRYLIIVALMEEIITRGYIYHYLKSKFTVAGAALITSLIFSLMHVMNPNVNILALFNIFLVGLLLNTLVVRDGNLWSAVGFHFAWNYTLGIIFSSPVSGGAGEGIWKLSLKGYELITGGAFGVEGGLFCTLLIIAALLYIAMRSGSRRELLVGIHLRKNQAFMGVLVIITLIYITVDIIAWMPSPIATDKVETNTIEKIANVNDYTLKLSLDTENNILAGNQSVSFINNENIPLNELYFHIYPNAFEAQGGGIDIKSVFIEGEKEDFEIQGEDKTLLYIPLNNALGSGGRIDISIDYEVKIPVCGNNGFGDRFGVGDNTYNLGNFFPIAAVYDEYGWDKHLYDKKGDAFYSEVSNFEVEITAPKKQIIACSGALESVTEQGSKKIWKIKGYGIRDFAFVSSDMFKVEEATVNGTLIKSYASSRMKAKKALDIAADAISLFNINYGIYPYPACSIVQTDIGGGMEYPNLVMIESKSYGNISAENLISKLVFGKLTGMLEFVVVHEIAHQWWYGIVGNDEYREAWIDEPLTQYATLEYYKSKYGKEQFDRVYNTYIKMQYLGYEMSRGGRGNSSLKRSLNEFEETEYNILIYNKGAMMFKNLHDELGEEKFRKLVKRVFEEYKFKVLKGDDLIDLTSKVAGKDMRGFYQKWLETKYSGN